MCERLRVACLLSILPIKDTACDSEPFNKDIMSLIFLIFLCGDLIISLERQGEKELGDVPTPVLVIQEGLRFGFGVGETR